MEYRVVQLAHKSETEVRDIQQFLNEMAEEGWELQCTQFLPFVVEADDNSVEYIDRGYLLLFFKREDTQLKAV